MDEESGSYRDSDLPDALPFPPFTKDHILHCSYNYWHPKYRVLTPKARVVPLDPAFVAYLKADGILLPPEEDQAVNWDSDSGVFSGTNDDDDDSDTSDEDVDPSTAWPAIHQSIKDTIAELGGKVVPKLNWSAPKDATWINATNSMECRSPNDVYLLLKSSDFVTHDLEHPFDGCADHSPGDAAALESIAYCLVLRKHFLMNPSVEFRCFVRARKLIAVCQRDLNHYDFLFNMRDELKSKIQLFFDLRLCESFPDANYAFDVYIPAPYDRVWLVDINPWAARTDPLLFSWLELLTMPDPVGYSLAEAMGEGFVRLSLRPGTGAVSEDVSDRTEASEDDNQYGADDTEDDDEDDLDDLELRLIRPGDPEAYSFNTPQYSAHKLPKDVVDAGTEGIGAMRDFANQWKQLMADQEALRTAGGGDSDSE